MSYKAETPTNNLSLFFLICVNGMLSCGLAFCSSELPVRTYKKGIKLYRCHMQLWVYIQELMITQVIM
jgi:hypothetical protein